MTERSIELALKEGLVEPCVVFDHEGKEIKAYRPTEHARHLFAKTPRHFDYLDVPEFLRRSFSVKCMRCRVEVPADKLDMKDRCVVPNCPLNQKQECASS